MRQINRSRAPTSGKGALVFDPTMCPLLAGLSLEEQAERIEQDPVISACIRRLESGVNAQAGCHIRHTTTKRAPGGT